MGDQSNIPAGVRVASGPTILMGDGAYFDFDAPEQCAITIEDVAHGLAYTARFRGQTRRMTGDGRRVFYSVAEHCVRMAQQMEDHGFSRQARVFALMHELGEVPLGDLPSPAKWKLPEFKALEKRCEAAIWANFGLPPMSPGAAKLIKSYDLRMLATEKRDLMTGAIPGDQWEMLDGCVPFDDMTVKPYSHPDVAADAFLLEWRRLNG